MYSVYAFWTPSWRRLACVRRSGAVCVCKRRLRLSYMLRWLLPVGLLALAGATRLGSRRLIASIRARRLTASLLTTEASPPERQRAGGQQGSRPGEAGRSGAEGGLTMLRRQLSWARQFRGALKMHDE